MKIGGKDTVVTLDLSRLVRVEVLASIRDRWPNCKHNSDGNEFFYWENQEAMHSWYFDGRTDANADQMVHILYDFPTQVTIVTDGPTTETIMNDLRQILTGVGVRTDGA